ncbi:MAG: MATE family efflux transporter [Bacteroidales bacterium]|nr:MATE family efflux transporter [Bacteroidales bacterium]
MASTREILLAKIRGREKMTTGEQMSLAMMLAVPAMLAQLSTVLMSYIDASMVGSLGAGPSASIGLVSTSTWIFGGFCMATTYGFSVQVSHFIGNNDFKAARNVLRQGLVTCLLFSILMSVIGLSIAGRLPFWLGGGADIASDATAYFLIYAAFIPTMQIAFTSGAMLQASGNMKVPSILNVFMCVLDVIFNYVFIFLCDMGVKGAALGTGLAEAVTALLMLYFLTVRSKELNLLQDKGSFIPTVASLKAALGIVGPMWLQNVVMRGAHIMSTIIVAPLGNIAIAANSFAITAESFCYMPGYGLQEATTTLTGQSLGARRRELASSFAKIGISMGAFVMTFLGVIMYFTATFLMGMLSNDPDVVALGAKVLKIEAFAEMMYAVSMVAYGACVGAGDTLVPSLLNLLSMWAVRIGLALVLTPKFGLEGYWIAMCIELNVRGLLFILHMKSGRWMSKFSVSKIN